MTMPATADKITVHLVDDDPAVLDALTLYLEAKGLTVRPYASAAALLQTIGSATSQSCVVSDVRMPGLSGLDLQRALAERGSVIPVILITGHGDIEMAVEAIKAGAYDFLEKPFQEIRLVASIKAAVASARVKQSAAAEGDRYRSLRAALTEREGQVMDLAVQGFTNRQIGERLGISPRTVEIYRGKVMEKMETASLAELVRISVKLSDPSVTAVPVRAKRAWPPRTRAETKLAVRESIFRMRPCRRTA